MDKKGDIIKDKPADTLQSQYKSVWSIPLPEKMIDNPNVYFYENESIDGYKPTITSINIDRTKIRKAISKMKNNAASGPDGIPANFIKTFCDFLLEPLEIIYKKSVDDKIFPHIWKLMYISPVKKPGKLKLVPSNYRPVALTSHLGKILESVIKDQIQDYIESNGLLSSNQHRFRKNMSCISQLLVHAELIMKH